MTTILTRPFHVFLWAPAAEPVSHRYVTLAGRQVNAVLVPPQHAQQSRWLLTFDEALQALGPFPRMFIEPDGAFVWVGEHAGHAWQLDGNLVDGGDRLLHVELKGTCPLAALERLCAVLGGPNSLGWYQLAQAGVMLDSAEFFREMTEDHSRISEDR